MTSPFDLFPLWFIYIFTVVFLLLAVEIGYRLSATWKRRSPATSESSIGGVASITLGLLAFLLAFIVAMAADRFDNRRELVMDDAAAARTVVLRAELLGEPAQSEVKTFVTEYVDLRLEVVQEDGNLAAAAERSDDLLQQVWGIAAQAGQNGGSESASLFIDSVNGLMTVNAERVHATLHTRVPFTILVAIYLIAFLSLVLEGSQSRFQGSRNLISMAVLVLVLSVVILLIFDLDRPNDGFLKVNQQPMLDLQAELHPSSASSEADRVALRLTENIRLSQPLQTPYMRRSEHGRRFMLLASMPDDVHADWYPLPQDSVLLGDAAYVDIPGRLPIPLLRPVPRQSADRPGKHSP